MKLMKPSVIKQGLDQSKALLTEMAQAREKFDKQAELDESAFRSVVEDLVLTKLSLMCMRALTAGDQSIEKVRPPFQAELNEALSFLGQSFPWAERLPQSLAERMRDTIAAKRARK